MTFNQPRFLLLTGVLTASIGLAVMAGCTIKSGDPAAEGQEQNVTAPTAPTTDDAKKDGADAAPPPKGTSSSSSSGGSSSGGTKDAGTTDSGNKDSGAVACLDDSAPAAQPACPTAGAGDECAQACTDYAANFKKGLSADIRKCLTKALCDANTTNTCTDKALAKACADPTATTFCTKNVADCKSFNAADTLTQASCESIAKGMTATGRAALRTCFENEQVCGDCIAKLK